MFDSYSYAVRLPIPAVLSSSSLSGFPGLEECRRSRRPVPFVSGLPQACANIPQPNLPGNRERPIGIDEKSRDSSQHVNGGGNQQGDAPRTPPLNTVAHGNWGNRTAQIRECIHA